MNSLWTAFIGIFQVALFFLAQAFGGDISLAIIAVSLTFRLALLPLSIYLARRAQASQAILKAMQPELEKLKKRFKNQPERLAQETMKLYQKRGYKAVDGKGLLGNFAQIPFVAGLYSAISQGLEGGGRFLWIADIARPDILLAVLVAVLTYVSSALAPNLPPQGRALAVWAPVVITFIFAWRLSAGLGLYWAVSSGVGILQNVILRSRLAKAA